MRLQRSSSRVTSSVPLHGTFADAGQDLSTRYTREVQYGSMAYLSRGAAACASTCRHAHGHELLLECG
jgi:hypothetical protein